MVEVAVGILAKEPIDPVKPVREWADDVLSEYSDVSPSPLARAALLENPIEIDTVPINPDKLSGLKLATKSSGPATQPRFPPRQSSKIRAEAPLAFTSVV